MKIQSLALSFIAASLFAGCASPKCQSCGPINQTKVSKETAEKAALAKVPGVVKEGKMEEYKGKDYWTFEIATPGSKKVTEVAVDPNTGKVVWSGTE